jgi:hypothetical protein
MVVDKSSQRSYQLKFGNLLKKLHSKNFFKNYKKNIKKISAGGASSTALLDNNYNIK